jgi:hypothetical protein
MKLKISLAAAMVLSSLILRSQIILSQDFTGYDGTLAGIPGGWHFSWNSTSSPSFYSSSSYTGLNAPSYKFGVNNATIISPAFSQADSLSFWIKASTTYSVANTLEIYESQDSSTWNLLASMDSLPTTGTNFQFGLSSASAYVKFVYIKVSGNLAIDDIAVIKNAPLFVPTITEKEKFSFFPNPSSGLVNINSQVGLPALVRIYNLQGVIKMETRLINTRSFDLFSLNNGAYFIQIINSEEKFSDFLFLVK